MQSPQATHLALKSPRSTAPGGNTGTGRSGTPGSDTWAKPPSVVFSAMSAAASTATPFSASRRVTPPSALGVPPDTAPKQARQFPQPGPTWWAQTLFFERRVKSVPAGQIQLHQILPFPIAARTTTSAKAATPGQKSVSALP